jgi:hypothetical protein
MDSLRFGMGRALKLVFVIVGVAILAGLGYGAWLFRMGPWGVFRTTVYNNSQAEIEVSGYRVSGWRFGGGVTMTAKVSGHIEIWKGGLGSVSHGGVIVFGIGGRHLQCIETGEGVGGQNSAYQVEADGKIYRLKADIGQPLNPKQLEDGFSIRANSIEITNPDKFEFYTLPAYL